MLVDQAFSRHDENAPVLGPEGPGFKSRRPDSSQSYCGNPLHSAPPPPIAFVGLPCSIKDRL